MKYPLLKEQSPERIAATPTYYHKWHVLFVISFWGLALPVFVRQKDSVKIDRRLGRGLSRNKDI
jgi:hypothetical protein